MTVRDIQMGENDLLESCNK